MWRSRPRAQLLLLQGHLRRLGPSDRPSSFSHRYSQDHHNWSQYPVRIVGPTIWGIAAVSTIFFTCAAYDVYQDLRRYNKEKRRTLTFEQLETDKYYRNLRESYSTPVSGNTGSIVATSPSAMWHSLSPPTQVVTAITGINIATMALQRAPSTLAQNWVASFAHIPAQGAFRYSQLLTSAFVHTGPLHMGVNMLVLANFGPKLARSPEFNGSGSHTVAFYLSAGIISALGSHLSTLFWPNKSHRIRPGVGFSGVVSAILAGWCMSHPNAQIGILLLPFTFSAQGFLQGSAIFEALGVLGAWRFLSLDVAYACHLTGMAFGAAYVTYGKKGRIWTPCRRRAFQTMKLLRIA